MKVRTEAARLLDCALAGKVSSDVRNELELVSFLYTLMRDELAAGVVERLATEATKHPDALFTNGWLATYAADIAARLRPQPERPAAGQSGTLNLWGFEKVDVDDLGFQHYTGVRYERTDGRQLVCGRCKVCVRDHGPEAVNLETWRIGHALACLGKKV